MSALPPYCMYSMLTIFKLATVAAVLFDYQNIHSNSLNIEQQYLNNIIMYNYKYTMKQIEVLKIFKHIYDLICKNPTYRVF